MFEGWSPRSVGLRGNDRSEPSDPAAADTRDRSGDGHDPGLINLHYAGRGGVAGTGHRTYRTRQPCYPFHHPQPLRKRTSGPDPAYLCRGQELGGAGGAKLLEPHTKSMLDPYDFWVCTSPPPETKSWLRPWQRRGHTSKSRILKVDQYPKLRRHSPPPNRIFRSLPRYSESHPRTNPAGIATTCSDLVDRGEFTPFVSEFFPGDFWCNSSIAGRLYFLVTSFGYL